MDILFFIPLESPFCKSVPTLKAPSVLAFIFVHGWDVRQPAWSWVWRPKFGICLLIRPRKMDDFSHLKVLLENRCTNLSREWEGGRGCMPPERGRTQLHQGCDGLVSTCKQRSEPQALLAVGNPTQMYNNSLHRCPTEVHAVCTFVGIL